MKEYTFTLTERCTRSETVTITARSEEEARAIIDAKGYAHTEDWYHPVVSKEIQLTWVKDSPKYFSKPIAKDDADTVSHIVDDFCLNCSYIHPEEEELEGGDPCRGCKVREMLDIIAKESK